MSKHEKLIQRLLLSPKDFQWDELVMLMTGLGYELKRNGGSSRKFLHAETAVVLMMHEPHPQSILKAYQVRAVIALLKREKQI